MSDTKSENRIGRIRTSLELLKSWELVLPAFARLVVVQCNFIYHGGYNEITAFSQDFEVVPEGTVPPLYRCTFYREDGTPTRVEFTMEAE